MTNNLINYNVLDEDNMASDSATAIITQQSAKAYIDSLSGTPDFALLATQTVSSQVASVDFTGLSSSYPILKLSISNLDPETNARDLWLRTSTDNGSTFEAGASDYSWAWMGEGVTDANDTADNQIVLGANLRGADNYGGSLTIYIFNPTASGTETDVICEGAYWRSSTTSGQIFQSVGRRLNAEDNDAIQLLMETDNIDSGIFKLYGAV